MPNPSELEREQYLSQLSTALYGQDYDSVPLENSGTVRGTFIPCAGRDALTTINAKGGKQSFSPFETRRIPQRALLAVAAIVSFGHWKYDNIDDPDDQNWKLIHRYDNENHAMNHLVLHAAGDKSDIHLPRAACRVLFALEQWIDENPELMDQLVADARASYERRTRLAQTAGPG